MPITESRMSFPLRCNRPSVDEGEDMPAWDR
jgi:hypothetical protein